MREEERTPQSLGFGRLFDAVRDAVIVADNEGRIVLWNPAAERMFGYPPREAVGRNVSLIVPASLRERHAAGMARFRHAGTGPLVESGAVLELPAVRKDGVEIVIEMTLSRVDGFVMSILRDITERVRLREASERDAAQLREANETLESFAYVVGHDLKQPVRAVDAYLDELAQRPLDEESRELLETARQANQQMSALLAGLLEWSRASAGGADLVPLDVRATILGKACCSRYQRVMEEREARLDIARDLRPVLGTEGLLCQLFGNLVLNAIEHNPAPQPRVEVVALGEEGPHAVLAVRDNGPGFPERVMRRAISAQADKPSATGGFGMTIARRAARALGGRMELGSAPGGGAEVRLWLRRA